MKDGQLIFAPSWRPLEKFLRDGETPGSDPEEFWIEKFFELCASDRIARCILSRYDLSDVWMEYAWGCRRNRSILVDRCDVFEMRTFVPKRLKDLWKFGDARVLKCERMTECIDDVTRELGSGSSDLFLVSQVVSFPMFLVCMYLASVMPMAKPSRAIRKMWRQTCKIHTCVRSLSHFFDTAFNLKVRLKLRHEPVGRERLEHEMVCRRLADTIAGYEYINVYATSFRKVKSDDLKWQDSQ